MLSNANICNSETKTSADYDAYLTIKDIANILRVSVNTVRSWLHRKQIPEPDIRGWRFNRWKLNTIQPFLDDPIKWRQTGDQE